jgi:hypothetical protein
MKRIAALLILSLCFGILLAQVQELPDIEVGGWETDSMILLKREAPRNFLDPESGDLPSFIPYDVPFLADEEQEAKKQNYTWYLDFRGGTDSVVYSKIKITNLKSRLKSMFWEQHVDLHAIMTIEDWEVDQTVGFDFNLSKKSDLLTRFYHKGIASDDLIYSLFNGELSTYSKSFALGDLSLRKIVNEIGFAKYVASQGNDKLRFNARHQSEAVWDNHLIGNSFVLDEKESALHSFARYYPHDDANIALHIMFDKHSFFPSLGFMWRNVFEYDSHLVIANEPKLVHNGFRALSDELSWTILDCEQVNTLMPLDLSFSFQKTHFGGTPLKLEIKNNTSYENAKPMRSYNAGSDVVEVVFDKYVANLSQVSLIYQGKNFVLEQIVSFEIPYLPDTKEYWLPYHAPFRLITKADMKPCNKLEIGMTIEQAARRRDLGENKLPYIVDVGIFSNYYLNDYNRVYLRVENVLNSEIEEYYNIPKKNVNGLLGLEVRF